MTDVLALLHAFHRDKLALFLRHQAGARLVAQYDANNTYQYIINRDTTHLTWLESAIRELGGTIGSDGASPELAGTTLAAIAGEDAGAARTFVEQWRARVEAMTHARHRQMLRVILGEALEQQRFFEQAQAGQTDLLGRRGEEVGARVGSVMADRWIE